MNGMSREEAFAACTPDSYVAAHPQCHTPQGHVCQEPSGRACIEHGCSEEAGTLWGPYWCPEHDAARLDGISASLAAIAGRSRL